jgi:hypothetical protein
MLLSNSKDSPAFRLGSLKGTSVNVFRPSYLCASLFVAIFSLFGQIGPRQFDRPGLSNWTAACGQQSSIASPDRLHSAYVSCDEGEETRTLRLTVMDSAGKVISQFSSQVKPACTPRVLEWPDDRRVGFVCQTDPEVRNYVVFDIQTGTAAQYPGYWFMWSPDHQTLADVKLDVKFGTPAGENSCLFLNGTAVYPAGCYRAKESYSHIHTFILPLLWSADGSKVAFVEKIFDWEYLDPFLRYFDGEASNVHYYLVIASAGHTGGYAISSAASQQFPVWQSNSRLQLGDMTYDLDSNPPSSIP